MLSRESSHEAKIPGFGTSSVICGQLDQLAETHTLASTPTLNINIASLRSGREQSIRHAVLLIFGTSHPLQYLRVLNISAAEWQRLLRWLDISGLALYFLDRIRELQCCDVLPQQVLARLQQNLRDNSERTHGMIAESVAIQKDFQVAGIIYSVLKGFSLYPYSVPSMELRHQFDMDFLVAEKHISRAQQILEHRGYRLYAISGRSWEFKRNEIPGIPLKDVYKNLSSWSLELHVEVGAQGQRLLLDHLEICEFHGINMPVLSPVDLFVGQGLHAYKHICSEFSRTAHLLEFRRHVLARYDDNAFWNELRLKAEKDPRDYLKLGVVTLLITHVMGDFAPAAFTGWTVCRLPKPVRLWIEMYGRRAVLGSFPGSKLYLILQQELESAGVPAKRSLRSALLPSGLLPPFVRPSSYESLSIRIRRYRLYLNHILFRLRFHVVEGLRYVREIYRWRRLVNGMAR